MTISADRAEVEEKAQRIAAEMFTLRIAVGAASVIIDRWLREGMTPDNLAAAERFIAEHPVPPGAR